MDSTEPRDPLDEDDAVLTDRVHTHRTPMCREHEKPWAVSNDGDVIAQFATEEEAERYYFDVRGGRKGEGVDNVSEHPDCNVEHICGLYAQHFGRHKVHRCSHYFGESNG